VERKQNPIMYKRILLVQNDWGAAKAVVGALVHSSDATFQVDWVGSCSEALERLDGAAAILVDLDLPDSHGIDTFGRLFRAAPRIPILILVDTHTEQTAKLAVQRGAQDYLFTARLDAYLLPQAIGSVIERAACAEALFEEKEGAGHARFFWPIQSGAILGQGPRR
jgi:DNA-binding response OmpR family regulator